jgi:hypothetical protein
MKGQFYRFDVAGPPLIPGFFNAAVEMLLQPL